MKLKKSLSFALIFLALLIGISDVQAASRIKWYSYDEGMVRREEEQKNVFLNFYTQWCGFCKKMDNETFRDPAVIAYLNEHFISIKINSEKQRRLATEYYVMGLPTSWFISEKGEKISNLPGYVSADMLINILKYVHTGSYKRMSFGNFLNSR